MSYETRLQWQKEDPYRDYEFWLEDKLAESRQREAVLRESLNVVSALALADNKTLRETVFECSKLQQERDRLALELEWYKFTRNTESFEDFLRRKQALAAKEKPNLDALIETARNHVMTPEERRAQVISFAYGNLAIENPAITREMVERAYDELSERSAT
jgi:hypothetical protein